MNAAVKTILSKLDIEVTWLEKPSVENYRKAVKGNTKVRTEVQYRKVRTPFPWTERSNTGLTALEMLVISKDCHTIGSGHLNQVQGIVLCIQVLYLSYKFAGH